MSNLIFNELIQTKCQKYAEHISPTLWMKGCIKEIYFSKKKGSQDRFSFFLYAPGIIQIGMTNFSDGHKDLTITLFRISVPNLLDQVVFSCGSGWVF